MQHRLRLEIAALPFEIRSGCRAILDYLEEYFIAYRSNRPPDFTIGIEGNVAPSDTGSSFMVIPELEALSTDTFRIVNNCSERRTIGTIENGTTALLNRQTCGSGYLLTSALRLCVQFFLERNCGFFLHASCGRVNGTGILFTGKSTAGKTTALHNLHPDAVIAEDAVALRMKTGRIHVYAIPFRGENSSETVVRALFFPRKSTGTPKLIREAASAVVAELAANALFCGPSESSLMNHVLSTISDCCTLIPGYSCYFDKSTDLLPVFTSYGILN